VVLNREDFRYYREIGNGHETVHREGQKGAAMSDVGKDAGHGRDDP
jgi:hypothetical protein